MKYVVLSTLLILSLSAFANAQTDRQTKKNKIKEFRIHYSQNPYRANPRGVDKSVAESVALLQNDGKFSDMVEEQERIEAQKIFAKAQRSTQANLGSFLEKGLARLWLVAESYRGKNTSAQYQDTLVQKLMKGVINYGELEIKRGSIPEGRWHASCFAMPTHAINIYFSFFDLMEKAENGMVTDTLVDRFNSVLKHIGMQSWTQPYRLDETDNNVVQVARFRKHICWVGGNGTQFRSILPAGAMMDSVEMVDVVAEVASGALSYVSQNTFDEAFWTEGFTADGAGWGHGKQCLVWNYPIFGTTSALKLLTFLNGTPWAMQLKEENVDAMFNFFRGSSWFYFKGYAPPILNRHNTVYVNKPMTIGSNAMALNLKENWMSSLNSELQTELNLFLKDHKNKHITMEGMPKGYYTGTKWFFNNDNLVKKTPDYYAYVSMASVRCDGIESAKGAAHPYNFFTCDGMTFFQKQGNEYHEAMGGWNKTAPPGVTCRQAKKPLSPIMNWRGYCSKHNFAAAATSGGMNAASGFIYEKLNASTKTGVDDKAGLQDRNSVIYGVKAYKSWFMLGDYTLALGAGITDKKPEMDGDVWTTIDQTLWQGNVEWKAGKKGGTIEFGKETKNLRLGDKGKKSKRLTWVQQQNGFAYAVIPQETTGSVHLTMENRPTSWKELHPRNKKRKDLPANVNIFQLWIDHGKHLKDGKYGYITYMGDDKAANHFKESPVLVLRNDTLIQAASSRDRRTVGAVFYDTNSVLETKDWDLKVSHQSAVLLEMKNGKCLLSVTDASMDKNLKQITVKTTLKVSGASIARDGKWYQIAIDVPQGAFCGKPTTVELTLE